MSVIDRTLFSTSFIARFNTCAVIGEATDEGEYMQTEFARNAKTTIFIVSVIFLLKEVRRINGFASETWCSLTACSADIPNLQYSLELPGPGEPLGMELLRVLTAIRDKFH